MAHEALARAADALEESSKLVEAMREECLDIRALQVLSLLIESISLIGEQIATMQSSLAAAGLALLDAAPSHQCPECGLPLGSNADGASNAGCHTCTIALELHKRTQGNKCPDCGCLIGTNGRNCRRCLDEQYFQRTEAQHG